MGDIEFDQNMAMDNMWRVLQVLQHENNHMRQVFEQLQVGVRPTPRNSEAAANEQVLQPTPPREPKVSLLEKFDGMRSKF